MAVFISLLRGINVSGQKKIKMADLKKLYESINLSDVETYIQSGNVIFKSNDIDAKEISTKIENEIKKQYGFDVKILIKTPSELKNIIKNNPFNEEKVYVTFLFNNPEIISAAEINKDLKESEKYKIHNDVIYLFCPDGYGRTKLSNNYFEQKLNVSATTRKWKTINKLL